MPKDRLSMAIFPWLTTLFSDLYPPPLLPFLLFFPCCPLTPPPLLPNAPPPPLPPSNTTGTPHGFPCGEPGIFGAT
jgi:hypothetical protein